MHAAGADGFGVLPPGVQRGYIAGVELVDGNWSDFGPFYAQARLLPLTEAAQSADCLTTAQGDVIRELSERVSDGNPAVCGPHEEPSRLHGDLWSGNVLWQRRNAVLIDPSAHGGHRESDLAMLALFGLPFLDEVLDGYQEVWPLAPGWQERQALHQVYPLLVHALLFGGSYGVAAARAARTALGN
jgi:fructosamine-3-kinase